MESFEEKLFGNLLRSLPLIKPSYDKDEMLGLMGGLFDVLYPSALFRDRLPEAEANKVIRAKIRAAYKAAAFVEKNFHDWAGVVLLLLVMIGKREAEMAMIEEVTKDSHVPAPKEHHNIREYKRSACSLMNKLIDHSRLSRHKGGRPGNESVTKAIESALSELMRSEVEVSQEGIESYLRRKTGKQLTLEAARKRLSRKGKTLSEAKGKKRKSRKKE